MLRRNFAVAVMLLLCSSWAYAQPAVNGGGGGDWIRTTDGGAFEQLVTPLVGTSYDVTMSDLGIWGWSFGYRGSAAAAENDLALVSQYLIEYWRISGPLEWFAGGQAETWSADLTGKVEFLGGPRFGVRFELSEGVDFEMSGNVSAAKGGPQRRGLVFGLRAPN